MPWRFLPLGERPAPMPVNRTARQRSAFRTWVAGVNETLHAHPRSERLLLIANGELELITPRRNRLLTAGQLAVLPAGCRHGLTGRSEDPCRFWSVIAPNQEPAVISRDYPPGTERLDAGVATLAPGVRLPPSRALYLKLLTLPPGKSTEPVALAHRERLIYALAGKGFTRIGRLSGTIGPHAILHVPQSCEHVLRNPAPAREFAALLITLESEV